jgi:hypothetical protein
MIGDEPGYPRDLLQLGFPADFFAYHAAHEGACRDCSWSYIPRSRSMVLTFVARSCRVHGDIPRGHARPRGGIGRLS